MLDVAVYLVRWTQAYISNSNSDHLCYNSTSIDLNAVFIHMPKFIQASGFLQRSGDVFGTFFPVGRQLERSGWPLHEGVGDSGAV